MSFRPISQSSFSGDPLLPQYAQDLPPDDLRPSIPPAITSTYNISSSPARTPPHSPHRPLLALQRKEKQIQVDLQVLLDAQSEGLIAGLTGGSIREDSESNGSLTPTASSMSSTHRRERTVPIRQPAKKRLNLRGARSGLYRAIQELAQVKDEEIVVIEGEMARQYGVMGRVDQWDKKMAGLTQEIRRIEEGQEGRRVAGMRKEAAVLGAEISELEDRLLEMKARHRMLLAEAEKVENSVQSKLSSYKASLAIVDGQVRNFLARPPRLEGQGFQGLEEESTFLSLPLKRRTLDMAREHWQKVQELLETQKSSAEIERDALLDGAVMWHDVVTEVTEFEKRLRLEMRQLSFAEANSTPRIGRKSPETPDQNLKDIIQQMDNVISRLESKVKLAETKNWNLLVCCVGAEVEAFKEGREILQGALETSGDMDGSVIDTAPERGQVPTDEQTDQSSPSQPLQNGRIDPSDGQDEPQNLLDRSEDEDDEPDPALLISHQESF